MTSKALVTGAAGFIGSHLCDRLLNEGYEVHALDDFSTGSGNNLIEARKSDRFHFYLRDVRDDWGSNGSLSSIPPDIDVIFNLACPASPVQYQKDPYKTLTTSIFGVHRILLWARKWSGRHGIPRIVHASTSEVYGDPLMHPQREEYWGNVNPIGERACYDEGKRAAETMLMDASRKGADVRIVRIFNTYGPRMAFDDGRAVSNFVVQALKGQPITVFGDGFQTRSLCYVDDLIDGLFMAANVVKLDGPVNLGNPSEITILDLAQKILEIIASRSVPSSSRIYFKALPADDPKKRRPDITKAQKLLGFKPRIPLEEGLISTIADFDRRMRDPYAIPLQLFD